MKHVVQAIIFIAAVGSTTLADRLPPLSLPSDPTPEQKEAFRRADLERRRAKLLAELDSAAQAKPIVTLYTISPQRNFDWAIEGKEEWVDVFRDYPILGKVVLTEDERDSLLQSLFSSIRGSDGILANCFEPRHALTLVFGDRKIDLLICFECREVLIWGAYGGFQACVGKSPAAIFDAVARKHGLEVAQ